MSRQGYSFQNDWFSGNIPLFTRHLGGLRNEVCSVIEIGCHEGRATTWLLDNILTNPGSRITCIDKVVQENFWPNIGIAQGYNKVQLLVGNSRDVLRKLPLSEAGFIYIDGSHSAVDVLEDAVLSFRLAKIGAVIAFDDYLWNDTQYSDGSTPKPAIDAFLTIYQRRLEVLEMGYQVWIRKLSD